MVDTGIQLNSSSQPIETKITNQLKQQAQKKPLATPGKHEQDSLNINLDGVYKSLTVLADKVIAKLNEILGKDLPGGIASLTPEQHTSEATAQRIVDGVVGLFGVYSKQNPNLKGDELIKGFMDTVRGGIKQGHDEAVGILGDIGAFQFDGIKSGIDETMRLVDEKLSAFEDDFRKQQGLDQTETEPTAD